VSAEVRSARSRGASRRAAIAAVVVLAVVSALVLTGCSGSAPAKTVRVPDVTGMDWAEAQVLLSGAKLVPIIDARKVPGAKALTVVSQKPAPRTDVPEGTHITLVIVSGSTPATKAP
jgi:beta-lactam-binding protein with PASTA domain